MIGYITSLYNNNNNNNNNRYTGILYLVK